MNHIQTWMDINYKVNISVDNIISADKSTVIYYVGTGKIFQTRMARFVARSRQ